MLELCPQIYIEDGREIFCGFGPCLRAKIFVDQGDTAQHGIFPGDMIPVIAIGGRQVESPFIFNRSPVRSRRIKKCIADAEIGCVAADKGVGGQQPGFVQRSPDRYLPDLIRRGRPYIFY